MRIVKIFIALVFISISLLGQELPNPVEMGDENEIRLPDEMNNPAYHPDKISNPYKYKSLKNLTNDEIVAYMSKGNDLLDLKLKDREAKRHPAGFWALSADKAVKNIVHHNRKEEHKKRYDVVFDKEGVKNLSKSCTISYIYESDRSYNAIDKYYILRADPERSYLAFCRSWSGGSVMYNFIRDVTAYDVRFIELSYKEAKHFADIVRLLSKVKTIDKQDDPFGGGTYMWTSADGDGKIIIKGNGVKSVDETIWATELAGRWNGNYDSEVFLNFAHYLFSDAFLDYLGERWTDQAPRKERRGGSIFKPKAIPYEKDELNEFESRIERILKQYTENYDALLIHHKSSIGAFKMKEILGKLKIVL